MPPRDTPRDAEGNRSEAAKAEAADAAGRGAYWAKLFDALKDLEKHGLSYDATARSVFEHAKAESETPVQVRAERR